LLEIVSEPDMRSAEEAILYLKKLHSIVKYIDISDANMQEGSFRVDVNVSIRPKGDEKLYTRVEIKNINSFRFEKQETRSMRSKEEAADYRYFPEPDLLKVVVPEDMYEEAIVIPELPDEKKQRFIDEFGVSQYNASVLTSSLEMAQFFDVMMQEGISSKNAVTWLSVELQGRLKNGMTLITSPVNAKQLGMLVKRIEDKTISGKAAKEVLDFLMTDNMDVDVAIDKLGLKQVSDLGAIERIIDDVLSSNTADKVNEYKSGKDKLFGFFVGQVMKASKGSANPQTVNEILKSKLNS